MPLMRKKVIREVMGVSASNEEESNEPLMREGVSAPNEEEPLKREVTEVLGVFVLNEGSQ